MRLSFKEKLELAQNLRATLPLEAKLDEDYRIYFDNMVDVEDTSIETSEGQTHVYILRSKNRKVGAPLIINLHGGGFCLGHHERDLIFAAKIAAEVGGTAIDIDYKLAPEYSYPVALNETYDVTKWAYNNAEKLGSGANKLVIMGHSAGASLTAAVCLKANLTKEFKPKLQIIDYPATDMLDTRETGLKQEINRGTAFRTLYTDDIDEILNSPYVSMVKADVEMMQGLPEALVITAGKDGLRFQGERYALMMAEAGVKVTVKRFPDSSHGFVVYGNGDREGAHKLILDTIRCALAD